ncbi:type I glyceraldehyde-3-phosphate dehydrogenase [Halodesulfovibrio marinisediminis]|uniref:Glyceraldehyde-3-phosphate dehydrogenase (NAD+) n=1 Tax=Halodesulfovibrio marinisediminis DSM 17456 TaxID=1121457 RepID=A0A1N6DHT5_9BACT|nr:type I glyceraldehyde-3-phosphate dehydrogenase [Halodesulfovibrio marinisediminis]SIN70371.1 glyceraldehyde-3-phosphate dehydrogenase (NAD+) [Halodesulfovibrio marinisediminis DSM 17456]
MAVKLGINGFGRIGRYLVRLLVNDPELEVAVINARADNEALAHLFKYDSVHGTFTGEVEANEEGFKVNGKQIIVTRCARGEWKWGELGVNIAVETTGTIKDRDGLAEHIACGAKKSIISAPGKDVDATIVMGVNEDIYDAEKHHVLSNASCSTNCLAPAAKVLHETFGIKHGLMTTIHGYTMGQRILDGSHKDLRRARAAGVSMIPTTTGAAKAVGLVLPELQGKLDGMAIRVPVPDGSLIDLTCTVEKNTTAEEVNAALKAAAEGSLKANLGYSDEPLVSVDYIGDTHGGVVDGLSTSVMDGNMVKVLVWYDNEAGFTNQLARLLRMVGASL